MSTLDLAVSSFVRYSLRSASGEFIRSSDLYERFRTENPIYGESSDVKLAETFGKYLTSKRISSGKIWLDHQIASDLNWSGPDEFAVQQEVRIITISGHVANISLHLLGRAVRNLRVQSDTKIREIRFSTGVDQNLQYITFIPRLDGESTSDYISPPGLWITVTPFYDIKLEIFQETMANSTLTLTYDCCNDVPDKYIYSNSVYHPLNVDKVGISNSKITTVGGCKVAYEYSVKSDGSCHLQKSELSQSYTDIKTTYRTYEIKSGFRGIEVLSLDDSRDTFRSALMALLDSRSNYSTVIETCGQPFYYIRKEVDGYRACARFDHIRKGDWLDHLQLMNCPLPDHLLSLNLIIDATVVPLSPTHLVNLISEHNYKNNLSVLVSTTFSTINPPPSQILMGCTLKGRHYYMETPLRKVANNMKYHYNNVDEAFAELKECMTHSSKS